MITENYEAYADGGTQKDFRISVVGEETVIENSNMLTESIKLDEALCSDEILRFGCCEASQFTVQVANVFDNFEGKKLAVTVTMDEETTKYGTFKVLSDKPTADRVWRTITAYDAMRDIINADVLEWYNALTFPMTIRAFRDSFFNHLGITQKAVTLINDSFEVKGGFSATGTLSGKTIINSICEFNGVFGHINRDGNFEYVSLDSASNFICPPYQNNSVTYEDYVTEAITKVTMRGSTDDIGTSVGVDGNEYIIQNNPLIYGTEGTQALITAITNLLNKINQVTFRPYSLGKTIGNPCVELGDSITISTRYQTINSYVIKRVLSGIQALRDSYSATGNKVYPNKVNSIQEQINRTQGKMNELSITVDETVSTVTRVEQIAEAAQETADGLADDIATANQNAQTALNNSNRAIVTDTLHYLATPLSSGVTTATAGWTTTTQSITETNKYLWTYHTYTYADNHTADTTPVISGVYGNKGEQGQAGQQGEQGEDGIGITEVTQLYYVSNSSTVPSAPSSEVTTTTTTSYNTWTKGIPAMTTTYKYMFTCDQIKYTNNTFAWTTPVLDNALSTAYSEIKQMADQIVLKVDNNGNVVQVALSSDASTGSNVLIKGDNIQLDGNVTITSGFVLNAGVIQSQNYLAGTSGTKINLSDGTIDTKYFKVASDGKITSTGGTIGGFTIGTSTIYNGMTSLSDTTHNGIYIGTDGIALGKGAFKVTSAGAITANNATILGNITFKDSIKVYDTAKETTSTLLNMSVTQASSGIPSMYTLKFLYPGTSTAYLTVTPNSTPFFDGIADYATSAGDSSTLGGASASTSATGNTIAKRTKYGYIYATYFNQSSGAETPSTSDYAIYCDSNGWFRKSSMANMRTALQVLPLSGGTVTGVLSISRGIFLRWTNTGGQITGAKDNQIYLCASGILGRNYNNNGWVNMAANAFNSQSSRLIKDNIEDMSDDEATKILDVNVVDFDYNKFYGNNYKNIGRQHGVIAEDVLEIIPSVVSVPDNYNAKEAKEKLENGEFTSTMGVDYAKFTPYLIKMVQMQQKQIDELKKLIKTEE